MRENFDELYKEKIELYKRAIKQVEECAQNISKDFAQDKLFRVQRIESRAKELGSVKVKAFEKSIPFNEKVFEKIRDIAGVRIVVNNLQDIEKVVDRIKASPTLKYDESSYEDKISAPDESGYRGVHLNVHVDIEYRGKS